MKKISAAAAAILLLCGAHAHAASMQIKPGFYNAVVLYSSVNDPSGLCASKFNIVQGQSYDAQAVVGGPGKSVVMNVAGTPPGSPGIVIATLTFSDFPATITSDPTTYIGSATGSQHDTGIALSWPSGTINTIAFDEFKVTLSNVTVSYGGQAVCVISLDSGFVLTGR
jgi:hypothetical protein